MRRLKHLLVAGLVLAAPLGSALAADREPSPPGSRIYIIWPSDGLSIKGAFWLRMGATGIGIAPAGVQKPNTGHFHVILDADPPPMDEPIPNNQHYLHFGGGQTEARIDLPPGQHTLQLLMGDWSHTPEDPPLMSKKITVTVR